MMRVIAIASWVSAVLAGTGYAALSSGYLSQRSATASTADKTEILRINQISVPSLKDGAVSGYFVVRLSAIVAAASVKRSQLKFDEVITDETFKAMYAASADLSAGGKADLEKLMASIVERVNQRLGDKGLRTLQIQEFTFVDRKDVRK